MDKEEKFYQKCLHFLSYRPRSEREIKNYLKQKTKYLTKTAPNAAQELSSKIIHRLKEKKLIDDNKFAFWWIEQRLTFRPKGKKLLRLELRQKGINEETINQALSIIKEQELKILAKKIVRKKIKAYKNLSELKLKQKLFSHLGRRGFDFDLIKIAVDEILKK